MFKIKLILGLGDIEANFSLIDGIESKQGILIIKMTERLQLESQARSFASSSLDNKPFNDKNQVGYHFKKTFRKKKREIQEIYS